MNTTEKKRSRCQHRDSRVVRSYYDAQGKPRVRHAFDYCGSRDDLAVDLYGYAYCASHRSDGDYGSQAEAVDLDALLNAVKTGPFAGLDVPFTDQ